MPPLATLSARLRFGSFLLDPSSGQLRRDDILIKLPPQPFRLLQLLVERAGTVVTREEIRSFLWADSTFVDFEHGINFSINLIRAALSDSAEKPRYIETLPRRGYRFIAPLDAAESANVEIRGEDSPITGGLAVKNTDRRHSWVAIAILLNVACLLAMGFWIHHRAGRPAEPEFQRLSFGRGMIRTARFAPDGQSVVYGAAWDGKPTELFWTKAGSFESRPLGIEGEILAVSPSGQLAVLLNQRYGTVVTQGTLTLFSLTGSAPRKLLEHVQEADWSPDGSNLIVVHYVGSGRCDLEYPLGTKLYETTGGAWLSHPRISPRGDQIAFFEHPWEGDDTGFVEMVDLKGNKKILSQEFTSTEGLAWDPSGREIWFSGLELHQNGPRALFKVTTTGERRLVRREAGNITLRDVSPSGSFVVTRDTLQTEVFSRTEGENQEREIGWLESSFASDLSPDGKLVLLSVQGEAAVGSGYSVYLRKTDGSAAVRLGEGLPMQFSPDGKWAVTAGPPFAPNPQVFMLPMGAGPPVTLTHDSLSHYCSTLLPDGKTILFEGKEDGHARRDWTQSLESGKAKPITPEGTIGHQVSPDGKLLVAVDSQRKFWLYPIGGGEPHALRGIEQSEDVIRWSDDGKFLFVVTDGIPASIYRVEFLAGRRELLYTLAPHDASGLWNIWPVLITPNGKSYVYSDYRVLSDLYLVNGLR